MIGRPGDRSAGLMTMRSATRQTFASVLLIAVLGAAAAADPETELPGSVELGFLNGAWTDLDSDLAPIRQGGLTIQLSSPEHQVRVYGNRLWLAPDGDGGLIAQFEAELEGEGLLIADLAGAGLSNRFRDRVQAERQKVAASGKILLHHATDGYLIEIASSGPPVEFEVESGIGTRIVGLCQAFSAIPLLAPDCDALDVALRRVRVPMPQPGTRFVLQRDLLDQGEREFFDRFAVAE